MAYLDVRDAVATSSYATPVLEAVEPIGFTRREWQVIVLAQRDGLASLRAPGRLSRLMGRLFGEGINPRLADPRLEALRRLAVLAWQESYAVPISAIKAIKAFGFSADQVELLLASVANGRSSKAPNARRVAALA
jgi:hypothetical protein